MKDQLQVGVIGLGVGMQHIAGFNRHPRVNVVAACDFDEAKRTEARTLYPALRVEADADALLTDPALDVIAVASYDAYHHAQVMTALQLGKHVFVEKPLCLYVEEARDIRAQLVQQPHLRLSSNLILRTSPRFIDLKRRIGSGAMGDLFFVEGDYNYGRLHKITEGWRGAQDFYSVIYGGAVHMVDLILWLTGDRVVQVVGLGNKIAAQGTRFRYNDFTVCLLQFESGMTAKVAANFGCVYPHFHRLMVYGTQATFVNRREAAHLYTSRDAADAPTPVPTAYPGVHKGDLVYNFVAALLGESSLLVTEDDVFQTMSVCFAMEQAIATGCAVPVTYL